MRMCKFCENKPTKSGRHKYCSEACSREEKIRRDREYRKMRKVAAQGAGRLAAYPSGNGPKGWLVGGGLVAAALTVVFTGFGIAGSLGFNIFPQLAGGLRVPRDLADDVTKILIELNQLRWAFGPEQEFPDVACRQFRIPR